MSSELDDLLRRIRAVNPTDRTLAKRDRERRYTEKSRLQSELIRRFGHAVNVRRDESDERVVALEVGELGEVACHAIVDNLDEDARAWVLRRLDDDAVGPASGAALHERHSTENDADGGPPSSDADALLAHGTGALAAYDYDGARAAFQRAFDLTRGAEPAARALIGFLVDALSADEEALALRGKLAREVGRSGEVRAYLALAAARTGDRKLAGSLLVGLESPRRADALVALGHLDLNDGDPARARSHAQGALLAEAAHLGAQALLEEIERRARDATRSLEGELAQAIARDALDDIEALSSAILRQHPESDVARRAARVAAERRKANEAAAHVAAADAAERSGDLEAALAALHAAAKLDSGAALGRRISETAGRSRKARRDARVADLVRALAGAERESALRGLSREDGPVRSAVLAIDGALDTTLVDRLVTGGARPSDAVDAALAVRRSDQLCASDPVAALALLDRHRRLLERIEAARDVERAARRALQEARRRDAASAAQQARAAFERGDAADALRLAREIDGDDLEVAAAADLAALVRQAEVYLAKEDQAATFARLQRRDPVAAREMARRLAAEGTDAERARWSAATDDARAAIDAAFCVWRGSVAEEAPATQPLLDVGWPLEGELSVEGERPWIDPSRRWLVVTRGAARWIFVVLIELEPRRVSSRFSLRLPQPIDEHAARWTSRGTIVLTGRSGWVLEVEPWAVDVRRWSPGSSAHAVHEEAELFAERHLWAAVRRGDDTRIRVHDLDRPGARRDVPGQFFRAVPGTEGPLVFVATDRDDLVLHDPQGSVRARATLVGEAVAGAVGSPSREAERLGVVAFSQVEREGETDGELRATYVSFDDEISWIGPSTKLDLDADRASSATPARDGGWLFVAGADRATGRSILLALALTEDRLEVVARTEAPQLVLCHDEAASFALALVPFDGRLEIVALDRPAPAFASDLGATLRKLVERPRLDEQEAAATDGSLLEAAKRRFEVAWLDGDVEAARAAIDVPIVWKCLQREALARLATIYVDERPTTDATRQRRALGLALFLEARPHPLDAIAPSLSDVAWDDQRLEALRAKATEALAIWHLR